MPTAIAAAWCLVLVLCTITLWIRWRRRNKNPFTTRSGYVNEDGSVRKLTDGEKRYVETEFSPFDGARPFIKSHYRDRTAWGIQVTCRARRCLMAWLSIQRRRKARQGLPELQKQQVSSSESDPRNDS